MIESVATEARRTSATPVLSIIVTSYNIEDYIGQCLDGIRAQTLEDIEIIVVDDGSSDASPRIIADHARRDDRLVPVLLEENSPGGVATAANVGLDRARGGYVGFADGDDLYEPEMFEQLVAAARAHDADLAMCDYRLLDDVTGELTEPADAGRWSDLPKAVLDLDVAGTKQALAFIAVPWRKIYRRSLLEDNGLRFPVGDYFYEDNPFHWFTVISAERMALVPEVLCQHRVARAGQTMGTVDAGLLKMFLHHDTIRTWLDDHDLAEVYAPTLLTWVIAQMEWVSRKTPPGLREDLFDKLRHILTQYPSDVIEESFHESGKGTRARRLVDAVVDDNLAWFNAIIDGRTTRSTGPVASGLYHLRRSGVRETATLTGRYLASKARKAKRVVTKRARQVADVSGLADGDGFTTEDVVFLLMALRRQLARIERSLRQHDGGDQAPPRPSTSSGRATLTGSSSTERPAEVVVIAAPRTGTNFFCECLGEFPEIVGMYEIFNPAGVYGLSKWDLLQLFEERLGVRRIDGVSDPVLLRHFSDQPLDALDTISQGVAARGNTGWSYKVFPRQLDHEVLARLMASPHRHFIFLVRTRLDVFISYEKARQRDVWKNESTSDFLPEIDVDDFLEWAAEADQWYADTLHLATAHGRNPVILDYDDHVDVDKDELLARQHELLGSMGVSVTPTSNIKPKFTRQDRQVEPFAKIANGDHVRRELVDRGQLGYALSAPLSRSGMSAGPDSG